MKSKFNFLIIGLGTQGIKRSKIDTKNLVGAVDPVNKLAKYRYIKDVHLEKFNSAYVCTPDDKKITIIEYLIKNKKNVLVEKPLLSSDKKIKNLYALAKKNKCILYIAYNHRFEPFLIKAKKLLKKNKIGKIYLCNMFYGNGTSLLVKKSVWKDKRKGALSDLGSHLLDLSFWLLELKSQTRFKKLISKKFENKSPDYALLTNQSGDTKINLEMTYCMWRNSFKLDIIGKLGSLHMDSLCKWGPSTLILRRRIKPSGLPKSKIFKLKSSDPTWKIEHEYFKKLTQKPCNFKDEVKNIWINKVIRKI